MNEWEREQTDILHFVTSLNVQIPGSKAGCSSVAVVGDSELPTHELVAMGQLHTHLQRCCITPPTS